MHWSSSRLLSEFMGKVERKALRMCESLWNQKPSIFTASQSNYGTSCSSYIFSWWNIVFCSSFIIAFIVFTIGSFVRDIQEKSLWWSFSSSKWNLIWGSWISWSFLLLGLDSIFCDHVIYSCLSTRGIRVETTCIWRYVLTQYLPAPARQQSDQPQWLWDITIRNMGLSCSFHKWFDCGNTFP